LELLNLRQEIHDMRNKLTQGEFMDSAHVGRMNFINGFAHDVV
jgi:hypothetical protein